MEQNKTACDLIENCYIANAPEGKTQVCTGKCQCDISW